jgi:hypothetical protein
MPLQLIPENSFIQLPDSENEHSEEYIQELLAEIKKRVEHYLEFQPELLFSHLYRLDIDEAFLKDLFDHPHDSIPEEIAKLILRRQIQRAKTKKEFKQKPLDDNVW